MKGKKLRRRNSGGEIETGSTAIEKGYDILRYIRRNFVKSFREYDITKLLEYAG